MKIRAAAAAAITVTALLALAGCANSSGSEGGAHGTHGSESSEQNSEQSVAANDADIMFATMMIPHHEQAVEMADMILAKDGIDAEVVAVAEEIRAAQAPEIELMQSWLADWGADPTADGGMHHGDGMMTEADMQALDDANGAEASRLFLEQMIVHHEGAVEMAQAGLDDGENADAVSLAEAIIDTQTTEIAEMKEMLAAGD